MSPGAVELLVEGTTGLLVFVLLWSGAAKLGSVRRTLEAMAALRVPRSLRKRSVAALVPIWELALALPLAFGSGWVRGAAAWATALTLVVFTVLLLGVLRRGGQVDCDCFGRSASGGRVSAWSVWRNAGLIAAALVVALLGSTAPALILGFAAAPSLGRVTLLLVWALLGVAMLLRANLLLRRELRARPSGVGRGVGAPRRSGAGAVRMGDPIPPAELVSSTGAALPLGRIGYGAPTLLLFLSAECGSCAAAAALIPEWEERIRPIRLVVATSSRPDVLGARLPEAATRAFYGSRSARDALGVQQSPAAVALGGVQQPIVASDVAHGLDEIDALVASLERTVPRADYH